MDKVLRVIEGANGVLTCGKKKVLSKLDFRPNNSGGREKGRKERKNGDKKKA